MREFQRILSLALFFALLPGCGPNIAEQFEKAKAEGTTEALDGFEKANPKHPYGEDIPILREEARFKEAQAEGTIKALAAFVKEFSAGAHAQEATSLLDEARWAKAVEKKSVKAYKAYLKHHPKGKHAKEAMKTALDLMLVTLEESGTVKRIQSYLKKKQISAHHRDKALRLLDKKVKEAAGEAGLIRFPKMKKGKMVEFFWIEGYSGAKSLELDATKLKVPKALVWKGKKKLKGPQIKGTVRLKMIAEPSEEPLHLVALLKVKGKSYMASALLKVKRKALLKKGKAKAKAMLRWSDPPASSGKAKLHLLLVQGEVPEKVTDLSPVSNIVVLPTEVQVPATD